MVSRRSLPTATGTTTTAAALGPISPGGSPGGTGRGYRRIRTEHSGRLMGMGLMPTADSAHVVLFGDNGTADHLRQFV